MYMSTRHSGHKITSSLVLVSLGAISYMPPALCEGGAPTPGGHQAKSETTSNTTTTATTATTNTGAATASTQPRLVNEKILPLINSGYALIGKGEYEKAIATLTKAVKLDPESVSARRYLAFALVRSGEFVSALSTLQTISKMSQPGPLDWYLFGEAYLGAGANKHARACFNQALSYLPNYDAARGGLVRCLMRMKKWEQAMTAAQEGLANAKESNAKKYFAALYQIAAKEKEESSKVSTGPAIDTDQEAAPEDSGPVIIQGSDG